VNAYERHRFAMAAATVAALVFGCFVFGALSVRTFKGLALIGLMFCLVVYWIKPQLMVWVALLLAFAPVPENWHMAMVIGPVTIYAFHVTLILAIGYLIPIVRPRFADYLLPGMFGLTVVFFTAVGLAAGHPTDVTLFEAMMLLEMVGGFILALLIVGSDYVKESMRALAVTLWFSAGMYALSALQGIKLAGRQESLALVTGDAEAVRLITAVSMPTVAVVAVLIAAQIFGRVRPALALALAPPALIIVLLGFSRNTFICLAVTAVVAFVANLGWSPVRQTAVFTVISAMVFTVAVPGALFLLQHSVAGAWLGDQFSAFNHRVLQGISTSALSVDASTLDRLNEDRHLNNSIAQAPMFGHGLGYAYQPPFGDDPNGFTETWGTTYSHNFYLWWLCKAGATGMAMFALFALMPIVRGLRCASVPAKIGAAVSIGLLAVCVVAPLPEGPPDAMALGMALGAAMGFVKQQRQRQSVDRVDAQPTPALVGASA
jgi:O-Antigen ligase